jgi:hypothetical protein
MNRLISMKNEHGRVVEVKVGFSWTVLFFNFIPDLLRGRFAISLMVLLGPVLLFAVSLFLFGSYSTTMLNLLIVVDIIWAFYRNKTLFQHYLNKGYRPIITSIEQRVKLNEFLGYQFKGRCYGL